MSAVTADSVIVLLKAEVAKYNADIEAAARKTEAAFDRINKATSGKGGKSGGINYALRDRIDLESKLAAARSTGDRAAIRSLQDQVTQLKLIERYRKSGLSDTQAAIRANQRLSEISRARSQSEERLLRSGLRQNGGGISSALAGLAGGIVGTFGIREISRLNDKFIEFTNQLKIAGVEGENFKTVQDALFNSANKYGVEIGVLGGLFGKATQAGREFGATQEENLKFANAVAAAVKVQGGGVQQASGAILQLTQALQSGNVRAQEFNSLLNGLFPILQAAANASDKYGGSVAKLRKEVINGTLTSKDFFDLILKGADDLEKKAGNAALTTAAGFTVLTNQLTRYFGEADKASGVSATIGSVLQKAGENLDIIIPAILAVSTALGVNYVVATLAATNATTGLTGAMVLLQRLPIIAVITAIGGAMIYLATSEARAAAETAELNRHVESSSKKMLEAEQRAKDAGVAIDKIGTSSDGAAKGVNALGTAMQSAAGKAATLAANLKIAALANAGLRRQQNETAIRNLESVRESRGISRIFGQDDPAVRARQASFDKDPNYGGRLAALRKERADIAREEALLLATPASAFGAGARGAAAGPNDAAIEKSRKLIADLEKLKATASGKELATINKRIAKEQARIQNLEQGVSPAAAAAALAGGGGAGGKKLKPLSEIEEDNAEQIRKINLKILDAKLSVQDDAEKRADLEFQSLRAEYDAELKNLAADKDFQRLNDAAKKARIDALGRYYGVGPDGVVQASYAGLKIKTDLEDKKQRDADQAGTVLADIQRDQLRDELDAAVTRKMRASIQNQLLDLEIEERKRALERQREDAQRAGNTQTVAALDKEIASLPGSRTRGQEAIGRDNEGPLAQYTRNISNTEDLVEGYVVDELEYVRKGVNDAITKQLGVKDPLLAGLLDMLIKDVIIKPLAQALSSANGGGGFSLGGIGKIVGSIFGGGRASGGNVVAGNLYRVNEGGGTEGFRPAQSGTIIPLGRMNMPSSRAATIIAPQQFDLRGVVMTEPLLRQMEARNRDYANKVALSASRVAYQSAPQRVSEFSRDGT